MSAQFVAIGNVVMNPVTWYFNWVCDGATITLLVVLSSRYSSQRIVSTVFNHNIQSQIIQWYYWLGYLPAALRKYTHTRQDTQT